MTTNTWEPRSADVTQFYTYQHPELYTADWKGYYIDALRRREDVMARHPHHLNVRYGDDPAQIMDVFLPQSPVGAPVFLFFHGGGWEEGHPAFYDCLAGPWVDAGAIFVSCGYRLMPNVGVAESVADAAAVVDWWARHAADYGGDPQRLVVGGHSAGGHQAAMVGLTDLASQIPATACLQAVIIMSGVAELGCLQIEADADLDPTLRLAAAPRRVIVSYGNPEPHRKGGDDWMLTRQSERYVQALTRAGMPYQAIALGHLDHVGTARAISDPASPLYRAAHQAIFDR